MHDILTAIAAEIQHVTLQLSRHFGDFIVVRDQNDCLYVADLRAGYYVTGSVRRTW